MKTSANNYLYLKINEWGSFADNFVGANARENFLVIFFRLRLNVINSSTTHCAERYRIECGNKPDLEFV